MRCFVAVFFCVLSLVKYHALVLRFFLRCFCFARYFLSEIVVAFLLLFFSCCLFAVLFLILCVPFVVVDCFRVAASSV